MPERVFPSLQDALAASLQADGTGATAVGVLSSVLNTFGVRALITLVDDVNIQPCVVSTVRKSDITNAMVQGLVYELLRQAGVPDPTPQSVLASNFVVKYVKANVK